MLVMLFNFPLLMLKPHLMQKISLIVLDKTKILMLEAIFLVQVL